MAFDHDVDFANDYRLLYLPVDGSTESAWLTSQTPTGRPENLMSIGPAILWAPLLGIVTLVVALGRFIGLSLPLDGVAAPFQLTAGVAGVGYAAAGTYVCYRTCRLLFPATPSFWAAMAAWLATPALYYSLASPAYSHATSLFAVALFCFHWLRTRGSHELRRYALLGALGGLVALVRWQDGIVLLLPAIDLAVALVRRELRLVPAIGRAAVIGSVTLVTFAPQLIAWQAIYGRPLLIPQGEGFMRWFDPAILSVLFSWRHGLLSWTPSVLVALIGLGILVRKDRLLGLSVIAIVSVTVYVNAAVLDWWAGEAFGARRFIGITVFLSLGFACVLSTSALYNRRTLMRWAATALIVYNLLFLSCSINSLCAATAILPRTRRRPGRFF